MNTCIAQNLSREQRAPTVEVAKQKLIDKVKNRGIFLIFQL